MKTKKTFLFLNYTYEVITLNGYSIFHVMQKLRNRKYKNP